MSDRRLGLVVLLAAALIYIVAVGAPFFWDDRVVLQQQLQFFPTVGSAFFPPKSVPAFTSSYYRPVVIVSWLVDDIATQVLFGSPSDPRERESAREVVFHATNVLLHAASVVVVMWLAIAWGAGRGAALVAAAVFALHPLHAEPVVWMSGRSDLWMVFFALLGLWFATRLQFMAMAVCVLACLLSKESGLAVIAPIIVMAMQRRTLRPTLAALAGAIAGYFLLRALALPRVAGTDELVAAPVQAVCGAFGWLLLKLAFPWPPAPFEQELPSTRFVVAGAAAALVAIVALVRFRAWRSTMAVPLSVIAAGLVVALLPALTAVSRTPVAERYLYFATIGVALLASQLWDRFDGARRARWIASAAVALLFVLALTPRITIWREPVRLWELATRQHPTLVLPQLQLGTALEAAGRTAEAERAYRTALDRPEANDRSKAIAASNLGSLRVAAGALDEGITLFRQAATLDENNPQAQLNLAHALMDEAHRRSDPTTGLEEADARLQRALALYPRWAQAHSLYGQLLLMQGQRLEGFAQIREALAIDPALDGADLLRQLIEAEAQGQ